MNAPALSNLRTLERSRAFCCVATLTRSVGTLPTSTGMYAMTARWALYRLIVYRTLRVLSILKAVSPRVPIWLCPGPGVRGDLYHMRPEAHAPRHRLQRSPHITKASAIDPLDLWRVLGHAGALSTRALRSLPSLTPAAVDAARARVCLGHLRCARNKPYTTTACCVVV